jgi:hypothetical protein
MHRVLASFEWIWPAKRAGTGKWHTSGRRRCQPSAFGVSGLLRVRRAGDHRDVPGAGQHGGCAPGLGIDALVARTPPRALRAGRVGDLSKGHKAIGLTMIYPEPEKGGRGKRSEGKNLAESAGFSQRRLNEARTLLRHSRALAIHPDCRAAARRPTRLEMAARLRRFNRRVCHASLFEC